MQSSICLGNKARVSFQRDCSSCNNTKATRSRQLSLATKACMAPRTETSTPPRGSLTPVQSPVLMPSPATQAAPMKRAWHPLIQPLLWQGSYEDALFADNIPFGPSPIWKMMLLSDGSVTRHLEMLSGHRTRVTVTEMQNIGHNPIGLPDQEDTIPGPRVQRQVFLCTTDEKGEISGPPLVYAASWWGADLVDRYMQNQNQAIWVNLMSSGRTELHREICKVYYGNNPYLEKKFQQKGPFWGRHYIFWHNGEPLTLLYEVFSPTLEKYLGPSDISRPLTSSTGQQ